ncbi:hypothetical protein NP233_g8480 [Leucocoprinus birnbaumii]|uniref:RRM domain-containing protein n=1 Tax=Leucocoprinus birnbaumii TaxID=56174 RepID=A0AAD5YTU4_9AGAR|nr:hypothetical protein NP233_g8480 [Leucocoprinus birnbaumii]
MQNGFNESHVHRLQAAAAARLNNFHGPKRQLLGNKAVPAPAWKTNIANGSVSSASAAAKGKEVGSKILLSKLPVDVTPAEVEDLFKKTVGPLKDMFLVYNNQGKSKGMAVVTFARSEDAALARQKYDGKIAAVLKIEVICDGVPGPVDQAAAVPTLLDRLGGKVSDKTPASAMSSPSAPALTLQQRTQAPVITVAPTRRVRFKKGPKRLKKKHIALGGTTEAIGSHVKKGPVTKDDLDKEMEDYRAAAGVV